MTLSHDELRSLLAASAVNALPPEEEEELDLHLESCAHCRTELTEYQESASLLARPTLDPPAGLWDEIASSIGKPPSQEMPVSIRRAVRRRNKWAQGWTAIATGAVAAAIVLAVWAVDLHGQVGRLQNASISSELSGAVANAMTSPGHHSVDLRGSSGVALANAVITTNGTAFLVPKDLPRLSPGSTYQLWAETNSGAVSLGVLGADPGISVFRFEHQMTALMLTAEPSGGVPAPTTAVLAVGNLPVGLTGA
ncbi:MAG: anti-sigma factor [Acidimicrobiales bacterium]|jgi:anti-sigma factor RsiW